MFPRIFEAVSCPIDGYDLSVTLLANPTFAQRQAWGRATLEAPGCVDCAALPDGGFCATCSAARAAYGEAAIVIFQAIGDCDLSSPAACVAAFESGIPEELLPWVYQAPYVLWQARSDEIKKKLQPRLPTGDLSKDSEEAPTSTTSPI